MKINKKTFHWIVENIVRTNKNHSPSTGDDQQSHLEHSDNGIAYHFRPQSAFSPPRHFLDPLKRLLDDTAARRLPLQLWLLECFCRIGATMTTCFGQRLCSGVQFDWRAKLCGVFAVAVECYCPLLVRRSALLARNRARQCTKNRTDGVWAMSCDARVND